MVNGMSTAGAATIDHTLPVRVTEADIAEYWERGYWISPKLFDDEEIAVLRREVVRVCRGERDYDAHHWLGTPRLDEKSLALSQVCNGWWVNRAIREAVMSPAIG